MKNQLKNKGSIFRQLLVFTSAIALLPFLILSVIYNNKIYSYIEDDLVNNYVKMAEQYVMNIDYRLNLYSNSIHKMSNNTTIQNMMFQEGNPYERGRICSTEIRNMLPVGNYQEIKNCIAYTYQKENPIYGMSTGIFENVKGEKWVSVMNRTSSNCFSYRNGKEDNYVFSLIQDIFLIDMKNLNRTKLGFIKLDLIGEKFFKPEYYNSETSMYDLLIIDNNNHILYCNNSGRKEFLKEKTFLNMESEKVSFYKDFVVTKQSLQAYDVDMLFFFNIAELKGKQSDMLSKMLPLVFGITIIISGSIFYFSKKFSERVKRLVYKMHVAETGDFTITDVIEGNDEITMIDRHFNHMLDHLKELIHKNYIQELEKKETVLRNLQLQINPHFLYNTLETISSIAAVHKVFDVCELTEKLGDIFRYSLGKDAGEFVMVEQELQHTKNYMYIQKSRFKNKFEEFYNVERGCEKMLIPRFILQPLVENSVVHGLKHKNICGTLEISVLKKEDSLFIKIEDDGIGMAQEETEELVRYINQKTKLQKDEKKSIGVRNVQQRIQLLCGEEYGITIVSHKDVGSCFTIKLPCIFN